METNDSIDKQYSFVYNTSEQTRYYDPEIGRFISPDSTKYLYPESIHGLNLYAYCLNNPVMNVDETGTMPNWAKWLIGSAIIIGLGIASAFYGVVAGAILGAALHGAVTSAVSGAIVGGIIGGITEGWDGVLNGAADGFMWGAVTGGIFGAASAGIRHLSGSTKIIGSAQKGLNYTRSNGTKVTGTFFHRMASNLNAGEMVLSGKYSIVALDKSLKSVNLIGSKMPDVIGIAKNGSNLLVEVVSKSQTVAQMSKKLDSIIFANPNCNKCIIEWAAIIGRYLI